MADSESDSDINRVILNPRKRLNWKEVDASLLEIQLGWRIPIQI